MGDRCEIHASATSSSCGSDMETAMLSIGRVLGSRFAIIGSSQQRVDRNIGDANA